MRWGCWPLTPRERTDLFVPAMVSRGMGETMATLVKSSAGAAGGAAGLLDAIQHLAGRRGLVFLVSDFHWPLAGMNAALDSLVQSFVVPVVIWDAAEIQPPAHDGLAQLRDVESGAQRTLWMRPSHTPKMAGICNSSPHGVESAIRLASDAAVLCDWTVRW